MTALPLDDPAPAVAARAHATLRHGRVRRRRPARRLARSSRRPVHRRHGAVRLRQVDAMHLPAGRSPDRRHRAHRPRGDLLDARPPAHQAASHAHRLRFPVVQPAADSDGGGEHHAAAGDRALDDEGGRRPAARARRPDRAPRPQAGRAVGRPAAARRDRPRADRAPTVLFADEPTGNLDLAAGVAVLELLRDAVEEDGQTNVMVTHDPRAAAAADRVLFLADGRIIGDIGEPTEDQIIDRCTRQPTDDPGSPSSP